jgi:SAM-dependent MidA family methyltransferase
MTANANPTSPLLDHLKRRISITGPISVADYMTEALGHPQWGYYRKQDPFGQAGDFVTAPEISQMFGELIGLWAAVTWQQMGSPSHLHLVELGPAP